MPLIHSASKPAFKANVGTLMHEVGESPHVQSRKQALAIAYSTARRAKAGGGPVPIAGGPGRFQALERVGKGYQPPPPPRPIEKARGGNVSGFLNSPVPGRTDQLPITVGGGAYVLPADHIAALGQGNSLAGADIVNKMFKTGPYGMALSSAKATRPRRGKKFADGGDVGKPTPIVAAGGEVVLSPEQIMARFGDLDRGHKALDNWVIKTRQQHIKTLGGLKPPKKD